jgi:hypothetical protein
MRATTSTVITATHACYYYNHHILLPGPPLTASFGAPVVTCSSCPSNEILFAVVLLGTGRTK